MQWSSNEDASPSLRPRDAMRQPFGPRFGDDTSDFVMPLGLNLPSCHPLPRPKAKPGVDRSDLAGSEITDEASLDDADSGETSDADALRAEVEQLTEAWLEEMSRSVECLLLLKWTQRLLSRSFKIGLVTERDAKEMRRLLRSINFVTKA